MEQINSSSSGLKRACGLKTIKNLDLGSFTFGIGFDPDAGSCIFEVNMGEFVPGSGSFTVHLEDYHLAKVYPFRNVYATNLY